MKKTIGSYYSQYFRMPQLFREDLESVEAIIREDLKPGKYYVAYEGCEYEGIRDVAEEPGAVHTLAIYTQFPSIRLKFARSWAELYTGESTPALDAAIRKIGQVVAARERHWRWSFSKFSSWLAPLLGFGCVAFLSQLYALGTPAQNLYGILALLGLTVLWWLLGYRNVFYRFSCIDLRRSRPARSLWVRYRYPVSLVSVGVLLGLALGFLVK